ncbi:MAG: DUF935 family protein [Bacteroidales bacterium]|nr:DUF935 family protein [Bacteroidales bacterium]
MAKKVKEEIPNIANRIAIYRESFTRKDIADWTQAINKTLRPQDPMWDKLQELYNNITLDAHLLSQMQIRKNKLLSAPYELKNGDKEIELTPEQQNLLNKAIALCVDSIFYGYSIFSINPTLTDIENVFQRHYFDPRNGFFYRDIDKESYRQHPWYNKTLFEFNHGDDGILKQAVPHVLFKRFAQACWSELCEIYGMPPRYIKTNTQDPELVAKYQQALANIGSGASYVLDLDDEMGFANTNATNGEVYQNLIHLCANELSLLICGAVIGQDTVNGSNAKESASQEITDIIIERDKKYIADSLNAHFLPALAAVHPNLSDAIMQYTQPADTSELFAQTMQLATHYDIDTDWISEKFGIPVLGAKTFGNPQDNKTTRQQDNKISPNDFFA